MPAIFTEKSLDSTYHRVSIIGIRSFFAFNHWIFTWHYLKVAILFKALFGEHSLEALEKFAKRKTVLKAVNILSNIFLALLCSILAFIAASNDSEDGLGLNFYRLLYWA